MLQKKKTMKVSVLQIPESRLGTQVLKNVLWEIISSRRRVIWLRVFVCCSVMLKMCHASSVVLKTPNLYLRQEVKML